MASAATLKRSPPPTRTSPPDPLPTLNFAMLSDRGRVRHSNQDACAASPEHGAFIVCDGVGGAAAGEVASRLAAESFLETLTQTAASSATDSTPRARIEQAVASANKVVFERAQKFYGLRGMGTTLVALLVQLPTLWIAHVGDSRAYLFRNASLHRLTGDHSLVEEQVRAGTLTRHQADASPLRNVITRAVGSEPAVEADIAAHLAQPGDLFLLATDGLTRELDDDAIARVLAAHFADLESACRVLVDAAIERGGNDNITVLLVACPLPGSISSKSSHPRIA